MKALTVEELREMAGRPVWCPEEDAYGIVMCDKHGKWAGIPFLHGVWQQDEVGVEFNHNIIGRKLKCYRIEDKKEIPMELVSKIDDCGNGKMVCPSCGEAAVFNPFRSPAETYPYCPWCGQKLKGETE